MRRVLKSVKRPALGLRRGSVSNRQEAFICCCCKSDGIRCCDSHIENIIDHFLRQFFGARFALPSRMERTRKASHSGGVGMDYPEYDDGATCFPIELNVEQPHRRNCNIQNLTRATKKNGNGETGNPVCRESGTNVFARIMPLPFCDSKPGFSITTATSKG
jgi:hypothetical protein